MIFHALTWLNRKKVARLQTPLSTFIHGYQHMLLTNGENKKYLPQIRAPTLVLGGTKDKVFSREIYSETAQLIPNAQFVVFENASHMVPIERMKAVKHAVLSFLEAVQE